MKYLIFVVSLICLTLFSCKDRKDANSPKPLTWAERIVKNKSFTNSKVSTSYLAVYSHIYSQSEHSFIDLTATISIRNTSTKDTLFLKNAKYYNTEGKLIKTYFNKPIFIKPLETIEIIIGEKDSKGGSGANFIFTWFNNDNLEPLFEAIMLSTSNSLGISFTTQGKLIN